MGEHKAAMRRHDTSNALVAHVNAHGHVPDWTKATVIKQGLAPRQRRILEAALIHSVPNINTSPGSHELAKAVATHVSTVT